MSKNRKKLVVSPDTPGERAERWTLSTPKNFERIIWDSIKSYNYRAQLDMAKLLFRNYQESLSRTQEINKLAQNIALRIFLLYFETADQFALICRAILNRHNRDVFETYVEGDNIQTRTFFKQCSREELTAGEIKMIWGIDILEKAKVSDAKAKLKIKEIISSTVSIERKNLKMFGESYVEYEAITGKVGYASGVKGSFAIKHGFKLLNPSELAIKLWRLDPHNPTIMQEIVEITRGDTGEMKRIMKVGSLIQDEGDLTARLQEIVKRIGFLSREIEVIANIQTGQMDDPFYLIGRFHKDGLVKFTRNEQCACGSGKKFKRCHYLIS